MKPGDQLDIALPLGWEFCLTDAGFEVSLSIPLPDKTVVARSTMPWKQFIQWLNVGWRRAYQADPAFGQAINAFIVEQIEAGNYIPGESVTDEEAPPDVVEGDPALGTTDQI